MRAAVALLSLVLLAASFLAPAQAGGAAELVRVESTTDFWHAVRLDVGPGGARVTAEVATTGAEQRFATGAFWVLDAQGAPLFSSGDGWSGAGDPLQVFVEAPGLGVLLDVEAGAAQGTSMVSYGPVSLGQGAYTLVNLVALDGGPALHVLRILADGPASPGAASSGDQVLLWREADFEGGTNVQLSLPSPASSPLQARVIQHGVQGLTAGGSVFARFVGQASGPMDLAVFAPEGLLEGQTRYDLANVGHGSYQFLVRGLVDARVPAPGCEQVPACPGAAVYALVGDVGLP